MTKLSVDELAERLIPDGYLDNEADARLAALKIILALDDLDAATDHIDHIDHIDHSDRSDRSARSDDPRWMTTDLGDEQRWTCSGQPTAKQPSMASTWFRPSHVRTPSG